MKIITHALLATLLLCSLYCSGLGQQKPHIQLKSLGQNQVLIEILKLEPPTQHPSFSDRGRTRARWRIWYEFGDGNHKILEEGKDKNPLSCIHTYAKKADHKLTVFLFPLYSSDLNPKPLTAKVKASLLSRNRKKSAQPLEGNMSFTAIESGSVAPGYEVRYELKVQLPPEEKEGYIAISFNREQEYKELPNTYAFKDNLLHQQSYHARFEELPNTANLPGVNLNQLLGEEYYKTKKFKVSAFTHPNRTASFYFSLKVKEHIPAPKLSLKDIQEGRHVKPVVDLKVHTAFISSRGKIDTMITTPYLLRAVDPNGIKGLPLHQVFRKSDSLARFKIEFENSGAGVAHSVGIILPASDKDGLRFSLPNKKGKGKNIIKVKETTPKHCARCTDERMEKKLPCYTLSLTREKDLFIKLKHIQLKGAMQVSRTHEKSKKDEYRGHVELEIPLNPEEASYQKILTERATILFYGDHGVSKLETGKGGKVKWVDRQLVLDGGVQQELEDITGDLLGYNIGLSRQQLKLNGKNGFRFGIRYTLTTDFKEQALVQNPSVLIEDSIQLKSLELEYARVQNLVRGISFIYGVGLIIPTGGNYSAVVTNYQTNNSSFVRYDIGLASKKIDGPAERMFGIKGLVGLEIGGSSRIGLGIYVEPIMINQQIRQGYIDSENSCAGVPTCPPPDLIPIRRLNRVRVGVKIPLNNYKMPW